MSAQANNNSQPHYMVAQYRGFQIIPSGPMALSHIVPRIKSDVSHVWKLVDQDMIVQEVVDEQNVVLM